MKNLLVTTGMIAIIVFGFYLGKYLYLKPKNIAGDQAKDIRAELLDGTPFSLKSLEGKYVLLDFWASWCQPCRENHPQMIALYDRFQNENFRDSDGFEIVSIGVERSRENWLSAIYKDSLIWPYHLLSLGDFDTPIVKSYNVKQVPTKFLINPDGLIMAVDPSLEEVAKLLQSRVVTRSHKG